MEIVFTDKKHELILDNQVVGIYGDVLDLIKLGVDIDGIDYDDNWTVKRFLNGHHLKLNKRINYIFKYLSLDLNILKKRIKELTKTNFKFILLAKLLLVNKKIIIFDYFEVGLSYTDRKKMIKTIRSLKKDGISIVMISKNLELLSQVVDTLNVVEDGKILYTGSVIDLVDKKIVEDPKIIKFIKLANKKGAKLDYTLDNKELLKSIYRSVGK